MFKDCARFFLEKQSSVSSKESNGTSCRFLRKPTCQTQNLRDVKQSGKKPAYGPVEYMYSVPFPVVGWTWKTSRVMGLLGLMSTEPEKSAV